jgi:hypothetical protein
MLQDLAGIFKNLIIAREVIAAISNAVHWAYAQEVERFGLCLLLEYVGTGKESSGLGSQQQYYQSIHKSVLMTWS